MARWPPRRSGRRTHDILRRISDSWLFWLLWLLLLLFWIFGTFGFGQLFFVGDLGAHPFLAWLFGNVIFLIPFIVMFFRLHVNGVRVTGVAVHTWSVESTHTDPDTGHKSTSTSYYTKVRYVVGADRHDVTVTGTYAVGQGVPMVYDPYKPDVALSESDLGMIVGVACLIPVVFGLFVFVFR